MVVRRSALCTAIAATFAVIVARQMGFVMTGRLARIRIPRAKGKTIAHYTTQKILPALAWLKTGCKDSELGPGDLRGVEAGGLDLCVGKTSAGKLFCVGDKVPPTGTSLSLGGEVNGELVLDPQFGSKFNVFTGEPVEWCPSPIGGLVGAFMGGPTQLAIVDVRSSFLGGEVEVLVDVNSKKAYEADYWKGVLDAQGKNDGTFY